MSAPAPTSGGIEAGALALQRVLALEGRNALARVELAASELGRHELSPASQDRITAIREAVGELDGLLDKIERLADPARHESRGEQACLSQVLGPLLQRIAPALSARGVALEQAGPSLEATLALPAPVLERLLLLWLRIAIASLDEEQGGLAAGATRLVLESLEQCDTIELGLRLESAVGPARWRVARALRVELDIALAEWQGGARYESEGDGSRIGLWLPRSVPHA